MISLPGGLARCILLGPLNHIAPLFNLASAALYGIVIAIYRCRPLWLVVAKIVTFTGFSGVGAGALGIFPFHIG